MKILKIEKNKLFLEDEEVVDVNYDIINLFNLKQGLDIFEIYDKIIFESMKNKAIYLLLLKDRTSFEIKEKLKLKYDRKNYFLIDDVILALKDLKLIDDYDYALRYAESNISSGINKIRSKLILKGIKREIINDVFESLENELEDNQKLEIKKYILKNENMDKNKLISRLIARGYLYNTILKVISEDI